MPHFWLSIEGRVLRRFSAPALCLVAAFQARSSAAADDKPPATRHEIWVPSNDLKTILQKHPDAVMLDRAQYEALIRDAGHIKASDAPPPPVKGVIQSVKVDVKVSGGAALATITAKLSLLNLVDGWVEHSLLDYPNNIRLLRVDHQDVMLSTRPNQVLAVKGKGPHEVTLTFESPIDRTGTVCHTEAPLLAHPVALTVTPGQGVAFSKRWPIHDGVAEPPIASGNLKQSVTPLYWLETGDQGPLAPSTLTETAEISAHMDGAQVIAETHLHVAASNGPVPETLKFHLPDESSHVISVHDAGIASWTQHGAVVEIVRTGGLSPSRTFEITTERATPETDNVTPLIIDVPKLEGASRISAYATLTVSDTFEMTGWQSPPAAGDAILARMVERSATASNLSNQSVSGAYYPVAPERIAALVRRFVDRFSADLDTTIKIGAHEVTLNRSLTFHGEEGSTVRATFELEKTEQFLALQSLPGEPFQWKQTGPSNFEIAWSQGLKKGHDSVITLQSRKDVSGPAAEGKGADKLTFENLRLTNATRLAGYVALDFDDSWKVATPTIVGLEPRDARFTPVRGRMAWFGLRDFKLGIQISRNDPVLDVQVLAYALPRARNLEVEGQFSMDVSRAPMRQFTVQMPPGIAPLLRFDSPLIGGQTLDTATGVWRLTLRKELEGPANIRWHMSIAGHDATPTDKTAEPSPFSTDMVVTLPKFTLPEARHFSGEWIVEANTDTELHYFTRGVQPMDSLHVPLVEGYRPRHRVLAAYGYGVGDHEVTITASHHTPSVLVNAVIDQMSLKSVLNKDGMSRHRADLTVKHNGLQYFTLRLPSGAKLLSALVNDWTIKPVEAGPDEVRLPLPHLQSGGTEDVSLTLIYELKSEAWGAHGSLELPAPAVERTTPVMSSEWRIYVPEGMAVQARGRLVDDADEATAPTLLGAIWRHLTPPKPAATYVYSYDGGPFDNGGGASLLITRSYHIPANKLGPEFSQGHVSALQVLKSLGISFPTGSDASYLPKLGALTVTNTEENLAAIESLLDSFHLSTSPGEAPKAAGIKRRRFLTKETSGNEYPFLYPGVLTPVAGNPQSNGLRAGTAAITPDSINGLIAASANAEKAKAGIITLNVELPVAGRRLDYSGNEKPAALELHYATWETQMHRSLAWALLGALGFAFIGRRRPWLSSLTAALLLTCLPLIWLPAWMVVCNALLAGWLCVLIVWTSWRLARRWESWRQKHRGFATL